MDLSKFDLQVIVGMSFLLSFLLAAGIGANDSVNSFGSLFGAKSIGVKTILGLSVTFESLGSLLLGMGTANKIRDEIVHFGDVRRAYNNSITCLVPYLNEVAINSTIVNFTSPKYLSCPESIHLLGNLSILITCAISLFIANLVKLPASGTHVLVGSLTGYGLIALKGKYIKWSVLLVIASTWIISPVISGSVSTAVYYILEKLIRKEKNTTASAWVVTILYFLTFFIFLFSIFFQNSDFFYRHIHTPFYVIVPLIIFVSAFISAIMRFTVLPYLKKKTLEINIQNSACETLSNPSDTIDSALPPSTRTSTETPPIEIIIPDELECNKAIKILLKYLQIFTACSKSFAHGGNDVCNAVAPLMTIWMIYESGSIAVKAEPNILFLAFGALGMSVGIILWGTRVMETIGNRITEITPVGGFSIDFSSSTTVLISTMARIPISTTHCTVGSTVAIGWWRKGFKSVDKKILLSILICWIVSIPIPAVLSITIFLTLRTIVFGFPPM